MKVKRYFAANMRSALDMIKQEQGPDVLILSNRKVDGGVELITADELTEQEAARMRDRQTPARRSNVAARPAAAGKPAASTAAATRGSLAQTPSQAPVRTAPAATAPARTTARAAQPSLPKLEPQEFLWTDTSVVAQMQQELANLKDLLQAQLSGLAWSEFGSRHPLRARLMRVLGQVGLCPNLARAIVAEVPDDLDYRAGWHRALALLVMRLVTRDDPILRGGGRVALLGPTGVGKSTTVSKLAARCALKYGAAQVAMVSMDDRRLGAHQQLKAFGRLIGAAVHVARDPEELSAVLAELDGRRLVLIDTPGNAPDDARYRDLAERLLGLDVDVELYDVLSATTDYLSATKLLKVTRDLPLAGCILTKLDEAASLGPSLSALIESGLPIAYTSAGQRVPDDLDTVTARSLIERMVALAKATPATTDRAQFERAFSA